MAYYIGQALGLMATGLCIGAPLLRKRWQLLVATLGANALVAMNFLLLGSAGTGVTMNLTACAQTVAALIHDRRGTEAGRLEKLLFLCLYLGLGVAGLVGAPGFRADWRNGLELLPIGGAMLLMAAVFQQKPQTARVYLLGNAAVWTVYDAFLGSTAILAQLCSLITTSAALYRYRRRPSGSADGTG